MAAAVAYLRVSTREQGRSGLGLAAQRADIESFAKSAGFTISEWHQDVQTGKGADAITVRPGLRNALAAARKARGPLIVHKLARLARNAHLITGLMEHKVRFIVTAMPDADPFTLHIHAVVDEHEAREISDRTKRALAVAKHRGVKLGMAGKRKPEQRRIRALAMTAKDKAATARVEALRPQIQFALANKATLRQAAEILNARAIPSPMGARWHAPSLLKAARRLGLR